MTQRTITTENLRSSVPITRTGRSTSATRRDPWWISFGEAIGALFVLLIRGHDGRSF